MLRPRAELRLVPRFEYARVVRRDQPELDLPVDADEIRNVERAELVPLPLAAPRAQHHQARGVGERSDLPRHEAEAEARLEECVVVGDAAVEAHNLRFVRGSDREKAAAVDRRGYEALAEAVRFDGLVRRCAARDSAPGARDDADDARARIVREIEDQLAGRESEGIRSAPVAAVDVERLSVKVQKRGIANVYALFHFWSDGRIEGRLG